MTAPAPASPPAPSPPVADASTKLAVPARSAKVKRARKPATLALPPVRRLPSRKATVHAGIRQSFINLSGDYRFLRGGYWALVDAELNGVESSPTPVQAVTAQNAAACLLVARQAGIPTVEWKLARTPEDIEPPALLVPVSGMTDVHYEVKSKRSRQSQWRSATQNGTRAAITVHLSGELRSMRSIVGCTSAEPFALAWEVWRNFGIPLATIWFVEPTPQPGPTRTPAAAAVDGGATEAAPDPAPPRPLFLGIDPLPLHELTERDLRMYEEVSQRPMSPHPTGGR